MYACTYICISTHMCTVYSKLSIGVHTYVCASNGDCWMCVTGRIVLVQVISSHMVLLFLFSYVMPNEKSEMHWTPAQFEELQLLVGPPCQLTYPHCICISTYVHAYVFASMHTHVLFVSTVLLLTLYACRLYLS